MCRKERNKRRFEKCFSRSHCCSLIAQLLTDKAKHFNRQRLKRKAHRQRADSSPRTSEALGIIIKRKLEAKTIGVLTFCDKLDTDEDHEILQQVLTNSTAGGKECVPLKPHGYVATTNREIRKVAGESNRSRLLTQAEAEIRWFKEEGYAIDGTVTTDALISKLGTIYAEYVRESFIPRTLLQIFIKNREYEEQQRQLGLPAPPPTSSREELLASATTFAVQLFADVYTAHREFVRDTTLPAMASKLGSSCSRAQSLSLT